MRIYQCVRHAKSAVEHSPGRHGDPTSPARSSLGGTLDSLCDRKQLLKNWDDVIKLPRPKLEFQGSDAYLKKQWKFCSQGEVGWLDQTHSLSSPRDGRAPSQHKTENHPERVGEGRRGRRKESPNHKRTAKEGTPGVQEHVTDVLIVIPSVRPCHVPGP